MVGESQRRTSGLYRWVGSVASAALVVLLTATSALAQTGQVTGTVTDAQGGGPLSDAQVYVVGLQLGSLSRADGRFLILNVPTGTHELRVERIGYADQTQTITVEAGETAVANFAIASQALGLDEIVVTGTAGSSRRREIGNTISQISVSEVPDRQLAVTDILQGSAPGIEITGDNGQAGMGKQIRLRGNSSVSMTNQPIIYVDGVRMMDGAFPDVRTPGVTIGRSGLTTASPLDNINPNDIDRIEVIKGSAATTLFGTEASAGVIQIFTKRGSEGAPVWTAEIQQGTGWVPQFGVNGVNYLNMEHFLRDPWWGGGYDGGEYGRECIQDDTPGNPDTSYDEESKNGVWKGVNGSADGSCSFPGSIWYQNYSLSVRGGGGALQYYASGGYQDDQYALPNDEMQKYNAQGNFTFSPSQNLQIQWNTGFTHQRSTNTPSGNNLSGIELQTFRQERNYFSNGDPREISKVLEYDYEQWIERLTTGLTLNYSPIADLTNRLTLGYDYAQQEGRNLLNFGYWELPEGSVVNDTYQNRVLTFDYVGTYAFSLSQQLRSSFSWGGQAIGTDTRQVQARGQNFPGAAEPTVSSGAVRISEESREKVWNAGFFFQNVFDLSDKYFLTVGLRVDGNSAFGEGFGLQVYPKVSGVWVISDEDFWGDGLGAVKLRAAYGQSGRAPGAFDAVRTWQGVGFIGDPAFQPENRGNPDLGPEVTSEIEGGFDASFLNDRLAVAFTYYQQKTTDALMSVSGIPSGGFSSSQLENVGELENKGIELQVDAALLQSPSWGVDLGLGVSTNYSKVLSLGDTEPFSDLNGWIEEGHSVPVARDRRVANPDEIADFEYMDDGENVIIGRLMPSHFITPSLRVRVPGNILLAARGEYRGGFVREINPISISRSVRSPICFPYYQDPEAGIDLKEGIPAIWRERCTPSNGDDYWWDADYFKLRSVSASIPMGFLFPERISNSTLTLALNNAWSWYRELPWYDFEVLSNDGANDDGPGNPSERTPGPATFRVSLRITY